MASPHLVPDAATQGELARKSSGSEGRPRLCIRGSDDLASAEWRCWLTRAHAPPLEGASMATDPVQQIRELEHETPLAMDLTATLARLAALPPSTEAPYLMVSLDWRPEGSAPGRFQAAEPKRSERRAPRV